jgi:HAD superfamily hydrolase (TIGR01509 family)
MIRAVIFDMDGLIIDTEWPDYQSWQELYATHGHELTLEEWVPYVGVWGPPVNLVARLTALIGEGADPAALKARRRARCDELVREAMAPMAGYHALMDSLVTDGYRRGLASTSSRDWIDFIVDGLDVRAQFQAIIAGDEVAARKPAPDVYLRAAERLGVARAECVVLEDSAPGIASAKAAGMACIAIPNRVTRHQDLSAADHQVACLDGVTLELLRSL